MTELINSINKDIYKYLNIAKNNRNIDDDTFNIILPVLVSNMYEMGFDNIIKNYNDNLKSNKDDWDSLRKKEIKKNNISSTSVGGCCIIKRHMPHIYYVKNYKGKCISNQWTEKLARALTIQMGGSAMVSLYPVTAGECKKYLIM